VAERESLDYYELTGLEDLSLPRPQPPQGIHIRAVDPEVDLSRIAELYNAAFELVGHDAVTDDEVAAYARHPGMALPGTFLAFEGALAVGVIVGRLDVPAPGGDPRRAAVELLAVRPGYRRRGIAGALVVRMLAWLADQGVQTVVVAGGGPAVEALLRRYGFRPGAG
jgi:predicted N-acetyltransferase YhbS